MYKYMSLSWYFLIYMNSDCFRFQVPGLVVSFLGSGFFAEANSTLVAGRGPVGCGAGGRVMKAQVDHRNCEDWIDPTGSLPQSKSFPVWPLEDSWSDAAKVRLQNSNSCRGWDFWRCGSGDFEGDFVGFELEPSRQWATWGELKSCYLWMIYIYFPAFWSWLQNPVDSSEVLVKWATSNTC